MVERLGGKQQPGHWHSDRCGGGTVEQPGAQSTPVVTALGHAGLIPGGVTASDKLLFTSS